MADETAPPSKTTLYVAIGCGVLALILIVVVIIVAMSGGDVTASGGAAAAATLAAAEATRRRMAARELVASTKTELEEGQEEITKNQEDATDGMAAVPGEVAKLDDEALGDEADRLLGGGNDPEGSA